MSNTARESSLIAIAVQIRRLVPAPFCGQCPPYVFDHDNKQPGGVTLSGGRVLG